MSATQPDPETLRERIRNIQTRAAGVEHFNAFRREGESKEDAMRSILEAAKKLSGPYGEP